MMKQILRQNRGFSLIELVVIIVVLGILAAVAMHSMTSSVDDIRRVEVEREMDMLAQAIVGDASLYSGPARCDFGYVGDIGSFPPDLRALAQNPGYGTWNGPYIPAGFVQDTAGYLLDAWGAPYQYTGGVMITSAGSGSIITRKIANTTADYLTNTLNGIVKDANDSVPGVIYMDSVNITISIPDGTGGMTTRWAAPDSAGNFTLSPLPAGTHLIQATYIPTADTLSRYVTILPRHRSPFLFKFASAYFAGGTGSGCGGAGVVVLRPNEPGTMSQLGAVSCGDNWECVDEAVADDYDTRVQSSGGNYKTDTYGIEDPTANDCRITGITVNFRANKLTLFIDGFAKAVIRAGGNEFQGPEETMSGSFENYSHQWPVNPATGAAWTWDDIRDLEAGVSLKTGSPVFRVNCTQVWVEVEYAP